MRDQYIAAHETTEHVASLIEDGWDVVIGHGNGPQVGFILRRSDLAAHELHRVPLDVCGADTQGAIGYALVQNLQNRLRRDGIATPVVAVVTQVEVARDDPAFERPSKPVGSFMDEVEAIRHRDQDGWDVAEDAARGWRRVVASPAPRRIVELDAIRTLVDSGAIVVAVGGGGIPVVADAAGDLAGRRGRHRQGPGLLAPRARAPAPSCSSSPPRSSGSPSTSAPRSNGGSTTSPWTRPARYLAEGIHFAEGSMAPKIQAVIEYLEGGGTTAIITDPANVERALRGEAGTWITALRAERTFAPSQLPRCPGPSLVMVTATAYWRPSTIAQAFELLERPGAVVLAGGTQLNGESHRGDGRGGGPPGAGPRRHRDRPGDSLRIGAMTTLQQLVDSDHVPAVVREAARREQPSTLRAQATVGGCIATGRPGERAAGGPAGPRGGGADRGRSDATSDVPLEELLADLPVGAGRVVTAVTIQTAGAAAAARTARTPADRAIVAAVARAAPMPVDGSPLTGVAPTPILVQAGDELDPVGDFRGSSEYRRALAAVLLARVVEAIA